jgi:hypothetical protein
MLIKAIDVIMYCFVINKQITVLILLLNNRMLNNN